MRKQQRGVVCLGSYIKKLLYMLMLTAVFTYLFYFICMPAFAENQSTGSEQEIFDPLFSGPVLSDSKLLHPSLSTLEPAKEDADDLEIVSKEVIKNKDMTEESLTATEENLNVYVYLSPGTDTEVLTSCSRIKEWDKSSGIATVSVNPESFETIASIDGVHSVEPVISPVIRKIDWGGKEFSSSSNFWEPYSTSGAGIKIGIISDGVEDISEDIKLGSLPENIHILSSGKGTEGTVILKIVYKISPGADLYFHSAGSNKLEFNRAVDALIAEALF